MLTMKDSLQSASDKVLGHMKTIRIGATDEEPFAYQCFVKYPESCLDVGIDLEFIYNVLYNIFGLKVVWKYYNNFTDIDYALDNNEIDLNGNAQPRGKTSGNVEEPWYQTPASQYLGVGFFIKSPSVPKTLNPFISFSRDTWLCIIIMTVMVDLMYRMIPMRLRFAFMSSKFVYFLWFMVLLLIMEFYSNILTADLITTTKANPVFDDLDDLGDKLIRKECRFVIFKQYINDSDMEEVFNPGYNRSWTSAFRAAFKLNPPIEVETKNDVFELVKNSTCLVGLDFISHDLELYNSICDIDVKMFPNEIQFKPYVYYHKIRALQEIFNDLFISPAFTHLPNILLKRYTVKFFNSLTTGCSYTTMNTDYQMTLSKLYYCFVIWLIGISASALVIIVQMLRWSKICQVAQMIKWSKFCRRMRRKEFYFEASDSVITLRSVSSPASLDEMN